MKISKTLTGFILSCFCLGISAQTNEMKVTTLTDAEKNHPNSLFYGVNNADSAQVEILSPTGEVESAIQCFLVEKGGKYILFDTGLGTAKGGQLLEQLAKSGVKPSQIDYILLTHFHSDHIGGLLQENAPVFPRAEVYAPQAEYNDAIGRNRTIQQIQQIYGKRFNVFTPEDRLPLQILAIEAAGHTPGHTAYRLDNLLVAGDLVHGISLQLEHPEICASYDKNREQAIASRKKLMQYAHDNGLILAGMHIPGSGMIRP